MKSRGHRDSDPTLLKHECERSVVNPRWETKVSDPVYLFERPAHFAERPAPLEQVSDGSAVRSP